LGELHFLTVVIFLIEGNSLLTPPAPNHRCNIMEVLYKLIPLLIEARRHPDLEFHYVGPSLHIAFISRWLSLLNCLSDHLFSLKFIPLRATFGLLSTVRPDKTVSFPVAMDDLFDSIHLGGSLSYPFCELRNIAIAMRANQAGILLRQALEFLKQKDPLRWRIGLQRLCQNFPGQEPHLVKFVFTEGFFTTVVHKPSTPVIVAPMILPQYPVVSFQPTNQSDDAGEDNQISNLTFTLAVPNLEVKSLDAALANYFEPETISSVILLEGSIMGSPRFNVRAGMSRWMRPESRPVRGRDRGKHTGCRHNGN
jgi:hypothetical protein